MTADPAAPYAGLRVLDLTHGYGAIAGMILADHGADVARIETPQGGRFRDMPGALQWNRGKRSVALDLAVPADAARFEQLARAADVLVTNLRARTIVRLGLAPERLAEVNPALVHVTISGFEPGTADADTKAYEGIVAARTGQFTLQNGYRDGPIYDAVFKCSFGASMLATIGALAALRARDATGRGQRVHTSLVRSNFVYSYDGVRGETEAISTGLSTAHGPDPHNLRVGYRIAQCADGSWIQSGAAGGRTLDNFMRALGITAWFDDPRYRGEPSAADRDALIAMIDAAYRERPLDEWTQVLDEHDAAYARFMTTQEFMDHPQVRHNGMVVEVDDPRVGPMEQIGPIARFTETPWTWPGPAPDLGEHTDEVLADWAAPAETPRADDRVDGGATAQGPLDGVTIVDLATYAAAPGGPGLLADLGARVIKVEPPSGDPIMHPSLMGELVLRVNRGKERLAIDLKHPDGQAVLHRLVATADAVVHNFRPGVPERLGADADTLMAHNERLVYLYAASFGSSGPDAHRPAFDPVMSAMAGGEILQAGRGNPPQMRQTTDHSALLGVAVALLLGLRARDVTGRGQRLETTMLASAAYLLSDDFLRHEGKPERPLPDPGQHGLHALYRLYRTSDDWVFLACTTQEEWHDLCVAIGNPALADDRRFASASDREIHDGALVDLLAAAFTQDTGEGWERRMAAHDVACVRATSSWREYLFDPDNAGPGTFVTDYELPDHGHVVGCGACIEVPTSPSIPGTLEAVGASGVAILEELGYHRDVIDRLAAAGTVRLA